MRRPGGERRRLGQHRLFDQHQPLDRGHLLLAAEPGAQGERMIWLDATVVERLSAMRGPGESYSDVILRLVEMEARRANSSNRP